MLGLTATAGLLAEVVEEAGPDFVYQVHYGTELCAYRESVIAGDETERDDDPGACIVGRVLAKVGLIGLTRENATASQLPGLDEHFSDHAVMFLRRAQSAQDSGNPWGYSFDAAARDWDVPTRFGH
jgi:hypothetical protein